MRAALNRALYPKHKLVCLFLLYLLLHISAATSAKSLVAREDNFRVGRGIADVTGPAFDVQMWGYGAYQQLTEGIHFRLKSRAFIISDLAMTKRVAFVSVDLGSVDHNVTLEVVDRLERRYGKMYSAENVILSATHTHSGPGGFWHNRGDSAGMGTFHQEHFERVVSGIVESVLMAHENLQPSTILMNAGDVEGAGANRSLAAYQQNPKEERNRYDSNIDKRMTLLKFSTSIGDIGMINWHAVHPTSMTYDNRLISGDHKGYASLAFEKGKNTERLNEIPFVGAFAQANPGDVTSNLNLNNTGPGSNDFESTKIVGDRQLSVAHRLFDSASDFIEGEVDYRQIYVDFSNFELSSRYTGQQAQRTCNTAYGYPFFGGSTEDGGSSFSFFFAEGRTKQNIFIDSLVHWVIGLPRATQEEKLCQAPKAVLLPIGSGDPASSSQVRSISMVRFGQLAILAVPAEVTTMAGRRLRETVKENVGDWAEEIVIAGYSNGYAGYVTTAEEYRLQHFEGGATLHGQWTLAAFQEAARTLAIALDKGKQISRSTQYDDWRGKTRSVPLGSSTPDSLPEGVAFGSFISKEQSFLTLGEPLTMQFWSSDPTKNFEFGQTYMAVQKLQGRLWIDVLSEHDWSTKIRWQRKSGAFVADLTWVPSAEMSSGVYRMVHRGQYTSDGGFGITFEGASPTLEFR